jgi:zeaxanthin glucosyltransferase
MASIIFMIDIEEGHLFPSFSLARSLQDAGHRVTYVSIPDNEEFVHHAGFDFYPIFETHYPKGFRTSYKELKRVRGIYQLVDVFDHFEDLLSPDFNAFLEEMKPDLFVMSSFLDIESLILYYQNRIKPVLLRPFLQEPGANLSSDCIKRLINLPAETALKLFDLLAGLGHSFTSFGGLVNPLKGFYELVICPEELEMEGYVKDANTYYIGSGIDSGRYTGDSSFRHIQGRILYASLGSQAVAYRDLFETFFRTLTGVMRRPSMNDLHLVLSTGMEGPGEAFAAASGNVTVVKWVSQMDILKASSLALVHGGLGTIKECIYHAVPMIVFPVTHDQPSNGRRIEYHRLGLTLQITDLTEDALENRIRHVLDDPAIKNGLAKMRSRFGEADRENRGPAIIEKLLPRKGIPV